MSAPLFYVDENGVWLGVYDGAPPPVGSIEVPVAPQSSDQIWDFVNSEWGPVPPPPIADTPAIHALATLTIVGGAVVSVAPSARIGGAFGLGPGVYWVFFSEVQPDTNYIPLCYNHGHEVFVTETYEDYFVIEAFSGGIPSDPPSISVEIKRVI